MEIIRGNGAAPGIAAGKAVVVSQALDGFLRSYRPDDKAREKEKVYAAVAAAAEALSASADCLRSKSMAEEAAIMEAHMLMAQDPLLLEAALAEVDKTGSAPLAVLAAGDAAAAMFRSMEDAYFRERAIDILDVARRVARIVMGVTEETVYAGEAVILCGEEIEPSVIAAMPADKVRGIVLGQGSATCHAVIIAKARSIAAVVGVGADNIQKLCGKERILLDGETGEIVLSPTTEQEQAYENKAKGAAERNQRHFALKELPAETADGVRIQLAANIGGQAAELETALAYGAEGVGLLRSEFLYMGRDCPPTEDEQFAVYKDAVERCAPHLCVIRTMDIGGDKPLPYLNPEKEDNPFLGLRALRISLERADLFLPQLKAVLRAGAYGRAAVMLPMVISVDEIYKARRLIEQAKGELAAESKAYGEVQVGIMVETPAAAVLAPLLAKHVDFFSIGTNDLVQYTLAVDRGNQKVSQLYSHYHPAVLRLIRTTVQAARENGIWSGVCGEMAGDPYAAVLLLAMGIDELSMSAPSIPRVKETIRSVSLPQARAILDAVLALEAARDIEHYIKAACR